MNQLNLVFCTDCSTDWITTFYLTSRISNTRLWSRTYRALHIINSSFLLAINQVTLLGRVGANPQKRGTEEHPVVNFPLATHFSYKYESGDILQRTDWHRISVFKPGLRDTVYKFLKKGQRIYITGKLSYGEVKLDDGQVRTASTIIADDIIFFQALPSETEAE